MIAKSKLDKVGYAAKPAGSTSGDDMTVKFMSLALVAALAGCAPATAATLSSPAQNRERVFSTEGYSFLPPQGGYWHEEFGKNKILYTKQTNIHDVTFYAGAVEEKVMLILPNNEALVAFVRSKKNEWGDDGRYANISSTFQIDAEQKSCVRYWLSANDRKAKNRGRQEFLIMQAVGRFCLSPQDRSAAVDVFYSVRHVAQFDPKALMAEGEEFLKSLKFSKLQDGSNAPIR